jgi:hypothetical protein
MITESTCIVRNIRRIRTDESPLLPELKLINSNGKWLHNGEGEETNISKAVGEAIDLYQANALQDRASKKDNN